MQQKVFLIGEIYLFCIYFSLNNFNYPNKKLAIPSKSSKFFRESFAEFPLKFCGRKTKLAWVLRSVYLSHSAPWKQSLCDLSLPSFPRSVLPAPA